MKRAIVIDNAWEKPSLKNYYQAVIIVDSDLYDEIDEEYEKLMRTKSHKEFDKILKKDKRIEFYSTEQLDCENWAVS